MQTRTLLVTAAVTVLLWAGAGGAAVVPIVGFTNTQLSATIGFRGATNYGNYGGGADIDQRFIAVYSDTEPLLANGPNYTGPDIYGGRVRTQFDTTNSMYNILNNANNGAGLNYRNYSYSNCTYEIASLFYVKKANFAGGGDAQPVNVTSGSEFTLQWGNEQWGGGYLRCVVQIGSQLYVSQASTEFIYTGGSGSSTTYTFNNLDSSQWAPYDPTANIYFDADSATFDSLTLTNIQAAGFLVTRTGSGQHNFHWKIYRMDITSDVIPEPGLGLMVAGVALLAMARGRK